MTLMQFIQEKWFYSLSTSISQSYKKEINIIINKNQRPNCVIAMPIANITRRKIIIFDHFNYFLGG